MKSKYIAHGRTARIPQSAFWWQGLWLIAPRGKEKYIAVLQAYLDESGIHDDAKYCVLAGFAGSTEQWKRFEELYSAVGKDAVTPGFHAQRFFARAPARVSPYAGWTEKRAENLIDGLLKAIFGSHIHPYGAIVDIEAFRSYSLEERAYLTGKSRDEKNSLLTGAPEKPYYLVFQSSIIEALRKFKRVNWKVHFAFDQQNLFAPYAVILYQRMKASPEMKDWARRMGDLSFKARSDATPLQAADLFCHCWYQIMLHGSSKVDRRVKTCLDVMREYKDYELHFFSKASMDKMLSRAPETSGRTINL
jgi:hypothetical protein